MLASQSPTVRKRVRSFNGPRSPLNAVVTKDFNFQLGSSATASAATKFGSAAAPQPDEVNEKLSVLIHMEAVPCLPYAGEQLAGLDNAPLPFTR